MSSDPRDYVGYGQHPPHPKWPGNARVAVQVVLNYEEGGENCVLNGDLAAETFLSEIINAPRVEGRHICMEQLYEYGTRAGVWRLLRLFKKYKIPVTIFAVGMALEKYPEMGTRSPATATAGSIIKMWTRPPSASICKRLSRSSGKRPARRPWAGIPAGPAPIHTDWWPKTGPFSMTLTTTATTCLSGSTRPAKSL